MVVKQYIGLDGRQTSTNPFPKAQTGSMLPSLNSKNTYAKGTREHVAFNANFGNNDILGFSRNRDMQTLQTMTADMNRAEAEKAAKKPLGANRGAAGRGSRRNMGVASNAFAGNIGSVNTEVQNDDEVLPYLKGNM
jgi:hypothetical protein